MATMKKISIDNARASFITWGSVSTIIWLFTVPLGSWCQAATFSTVAGIGLDNNADSASGPGSSASSSYNQGNTSGRAFAGSNLELGVLAASNGGGPPGVVAASYASLNYSIVGNPNQASLPLTFNFSLTGNINAASDPIPGEVATASFGYFIGSSRSASNPTGVTNGSVVLSSAGGRFSSFTNGFVGEGGITVNLKPKVSLSTGFLIEDQVLADILGPYAPNLKIASFGEYEERVSEVEAALFSVIQPYISAAYPGTPFEIGLDANFSFDTPIPIQGQVSESGSLTAYLTAGAFAYPGTNAISDYSNTLSLESITVPADFNAVDVNGLGVVFDSGLTIPVTREGGLESKPVPESSSMLGTLVAGTFGAYFLLKHRFKKAL